MANVYDYPSSVIENAPRTNVGIVPYDGGVYAPRDPRIKDYLNYSSGNGAPIEYNRPEELEFGYDPNQPVPGGVYNTELNPYNPSSKFFPYDPDFSGIMGISAYEQEKPVVQKKLTDPKTGKPYYGEYDQWNQNISVDPLEHALKKDDKGVPQLELNPTQDPEEQRDTLFHEGKHFFIDKFGKLIPKTGALSDDDKHAIIYFADMWRKNPNYAGNPNMVLTKKQAEAFMEMHNLGKKWSQFKNKFTGGKETLEKTWDKLVSNRPDTVTLDQSVEQFNAYIDPKRGDVTTPTMSQQAMVEEAQRTGGTVNPHEATKTFSAPRQPVHGPHGKAEGGPIRLRGGGISGLDMPVSKPSLFQQLFDYGRNVSSMQLGGGVTGAGTGTSDSIPAYLSHGEHVWTAKSVRGMGDGNMEKGFKKLNTMMKKAETRSV